MYNHCLQKHPNRYDGTNIQQVAYHFPVEFLALWGNHQ